MKETELAALVVDWLRSEGFDVYQEVPAAQIPREFRLNDDLDHEPPYSGRVDIYAVNEPVTWAIEVKRGLGIAAMRQAVNWRGAANMVSIACLSTSTRSKDRRFACQMCRNSLGIGVLEVTERSDYYSEDYEIREKHRGRFWSRIGRPELDEIHKDFAPAGNAENKYASPFQVTCANLREMLAKRHGDGEEWVPFTDIIQSLDHHYSSRSSAQSAIPQWIRRGKIDGVELTKRSGRLYLRLVGRSDHE